MSIFSYVLGQNAGEAHGEAMAEIRGRAAKGQFAMAEAIAHLWRQRYDREKAARRGWQEFGIAATELIQTLTGTDEKGAEKLVEESIKRHQAKIDASLASVDNTLFHGKQSQ